VIWNWLKARPVLVLWICGALVAIDVVVLILTAIVEVRK